MTQSKTQDLGLATPCAWAVCYALGVLNIWHDFCSCKPEMQRPNLAKEEFTALFLSWCPNVISAKDTASLYRETADTEVLTFAMCSSTATDLAVTFTYLIPSTVKAESSHCIPRAKRGSWHTIGARVIFVQRTGGGVSMHYVFI